MLDLHIQAAISAEVARQVQRDRWHALKSAAPLMLGGRELPPPLARLAALLPAALLAALAVIATFTDRRSIVLDARAAGILGLQPRLL